MEQEQLSPPMTAIELLEQGGLSIHWDSLMRSVRESVPGITEPEMADVCRKLRGRELVAIALWIGETIHGYVVLQPVNYKDAMAMNVFSIYGTNVSIAEWGLFVEQLSDMLKQGGYRRLLAITNNPRILEIVRRTGWAVRYYCERVL